VHQFPVIQDAILDVYEERLRGKNAYIRCTDNPHPLRIAYVKQQIIQFCGARAFKRELVKRQIPHNTSFAGIYDFAQAKNYRAFFLEFLKHSHSNGLIMCHPGLVSQEKDPIAMSRPEEYHYFNSPQFVEDCQQEKIHVMRFQ
jgi:predicted glycoside hydrolase/deacetylase ChbG (UPF0249 family)